MRIKQLVTMILLLFVAGSITYLVVSELRVGSAPVPAGGTATDETAGAQPRTSPPSPDRVVVYYFYGSQRCKTCRTIEAFTAQALESGFPDELAHGDLVWTSVNIEEPGNEHFVEDYDLSTRTVVLVAMEDGNESEWTALPRVWQLVGDREAFFSYIQAETRRFLDHDHG